MKKFIGVFCILLVIASYFLYQYRTKQIIEKRNVLTELNDNKTDYSNCPLDEQLRNLIFDFRQTIEPDSGKSIPKNRIGILGEDSSIKDLPTIYILSFAKQNDTTVLIISSAKQFERDKAQSYTYLDESLIVYYGTDDNIKQTMIDTTKMSDSFDLIKRYQVDGKYSDKDFKPAQKIYPIK